MSETKHTPPPWRYYRGSYPVGPAIVPAKGPAIISFFNECPDLRSESEHEANARLIAAAPDLLAALEPFAHLAQVMEDGQFLNFRGVYVSWEQAQAAADAIAKAKESAND